MQGFAAVDIGNDSVKAKIALGENTEPSQYYIPNVIATAEEDRGVVVLESKLEEGIHCKIVSGALKNGGSGIFKVGNLATRSQENMEPEPNQDKGLSDQAVVMLLTTLAIHTAEKAQNAGKKVIKVDYDLSTGLPLRESKKSDLKDGFKEKLLGKMHEVQFLQTPGIGGITVQINFTSLDVYSEGQAAMMYLVTDEHGHIRNEELLKKSILINDIGGLSTDSAIIERGEPDNENSDGLRKGVSPYLDEIIEQVEERYDHRIRSRRNLVRDILLAEGERKNCIMLDGKLVSIQTIVDAVLSKCAKEQYDHLGRMFRKVADLELSYQIGGGAALLQKYLTRVNEESARTFPLRWQQPEESVWMIVESYWRMLMLSKKAQAAATAKED